MLLFIGIIGVLSFILNVQWKRTYAKLVLTSVVIYITYMVGVAGMYLFSMPGGAAAYLAGSERYRSTIFIAIYYLFLLFSLGIISSVESIKKSWVYPVGIYAALLIVWAGEGEAPFPTLNKGMKDQGRAWADELVKDMELPSGSSYLVCVPANNRGYMLNVCRYVLWTDNIMGLTVEDKSELSACAGSCEYILCYDDDNPVIQEWVSENYPEQQGKKVIVLAK